MRLAVSTFVLLGLFACSDRGNNADNFLVRSVTINGQTYNYRVFVPKNLDSSVKPAIMLYLHGSGTRGDDNRSQLGTFPSIVDEYSDRYNFIIVFPQCRTEKFWSGEMTQQALAALDATLQEFNGDERRVYLAGYSMGANGVWQLGLVHPGKFAALVPIAGYVAPGRNLSEEVLESLAPRLRAAAIAQDPYGSFAEGLRNTPIWIFHGEVDDAVPVTESRRILEALKAVGNQNVNYTEYAGVGHNSIGKALTDRPMLDWLGRQQLQERR